MKIKKNKFVYELILRCAVTRSKATHQHHAQIGRHLHREHTWRYVQHRERWRYTYALIEASYVASEPLNGWLRWHLEWLNMRENKSNSYTKYNGSPRVCVCMCAVRRSVDTFAREYIKSFRVERRCDGMCRQSVRCTIYLPIIRKDKHFCSRCQVKLYWSQSHESRYSWIANGSIFHFASFVE